MEHILRFELPGLLPGRERVAPNSARRGKAAVQHGRTWNRDMGQEFGHAKAASDEELLSEVSHSGDASAFALLFARYSRRIYRIGLKLTGNEQLSRDLVQETMLTVWQKAHLFDLDRGSADNWIFTMTRNRCFDLLRKAKRQPVCVSADDIWPPGEEAESVSETENPIERHALLSRIGGMLTRLPAEQQAVIKQVYELDFTHEEAARRLGIPLGTLKSRLRLGLDKLKYFVGPDK